MVREEDESLGGVMALCKSVEIRSITDAILNGPSP